MDTLPSIVSKRPPSGARSAATPTGNVAAPLQRPASAGSEGPAIALAELQKRLPPIQPPRTVPYKRRPAPHALSYEHQQPRRVVKRTDDYEKLYVLLDSKDQAQARAAVEAAEQHSWTRILLDHLHRVANLEESVVYRENGAREALVREEDRVFAMIKAESDAKSTRIRGRDLVSLQLKMHLFAIAQDEGRKAVAAEESTAFAQLRHKEIIYRPQDDESVRRSRSTANNHMKRSGSSPTRRTASPTRQHPSSTTAGDSSTTAAILKPAPPPSAPDQQSYAAQGRRMWGHQKQTRQQISEADAAVGFAVSSEQSQRESLEGVELGEFLAIERQQFEERHLVPKRTEERLIREAAAFTLLQEAHKLAAQDAVLLIMNHVLVEAASQMQAEEAAAAVVVPNAVEETVAVETKPDVASTTSPSQAALPVCEAPTSAAAADPIAVEPGSTVVSASTRRVSRTSSFKHAEAPTDILGRQRLMSASKEAVDQANNGEQLLTALEIVTIVDEVHHRQQSHASGDEAWKTSGIAALRVAQLSIEQKEEVIAATAEENNSSAAAPPPPCDVVVEPQSNDTTEPQVREPQIAAVAPPVRLIGPSLFPGIDVLCDVMLDGDNIDAHVPWKLFLSAVLDAENETPSEPSHNVRRLFEGHRNSQLNREYLEHVLWRVSGMHHGVVNALELMPTRWKGYASQSELEEEEILEVVHGETLVRERLIRDQINEYCSLLHFVHVRRTQSLSQPRTE